MDQDQEREMEAYRVMRGEAEIGALACYPDACADELQALESAGYTVRPLEGDDPADTAGGLQRLDADCTEEAHEPCDLSVAAGWVLDLADDTGTEAGELRALVEQGYHDKGEVVTALQTVQARLPETFAAPDGNTVNAREEAAMAIQFAENGGEMPDA